MCTLFPYLYKLLASGHRPGLCASAQYAQKNVKFPGHKNPDLANDVV